MEKDALEAVLNKDPRYQREAYNFVFEALTFTIKNIGEKRHISGAELLEGIREFAIKQFGPLVKIVFNKWGVHRTDDFGEIVFNLVEAGLMGKTDTDSKSDFNSIYNFDEVFRFDKIMGTTEDS